MWFFGEVFCFVYVVDRIDVPLILNYGFNLLILVFMLYYKIRYKLG